MKKRFPLVILLCIVLAFFFHSRRKTLLENGNAPVARSPRCEAAYQKFYQKDEVEILVIFGYKDSRPARYVGDRYERAHLIERLKDLNFVRDPLDDDLFATQIDVPDASQKGLLKTIKLRLVQSSVGPDDDMNRANPYQLYQSNEAERLFLESLSRADAVFYNGHSRDGGGPDFRPPYCTLPNLHVNYAWYKKHQPGLKKMLEVWKTSSRNLKLIGLFSCSSGGHFANAILNATPSALITTSSLLYYSDALEDLVQTLDALLKRKCQADFHPLGTKVIGFF